MAGKLINSPKEITLSIVAVTASVIGGVTSSFFEWNYSIVLIVLSCLFSIFVVEKLHFKARLTYLLIAVNTALIFSSALGMKATYTNRSEIAKAASTAFYRVLNVPDPGVIVVSLPPSDFRFTSQIQQAKRIIKTEKDIGDFKQVLSIMETNPNLLKAKAVIQQFEASTIKKKTDDNINIENKMEK